MCIRDRLNEYNQDMAAFNQAMEKEVYGEHPHLSRYRTKKEYDEMMAEYKVRYDDAMASKRDALNKGYVIHSPVVQEELLTGNYATAIKKEKEFAAKHRKPIKPSGLSDEEDLHEPSIFDGLAHTARETASKIKGHVTDGVRGVVKYTTGKGPSKSPKLGRELTPSYKEAMDDWENDMKVWEAAKDEYAAKKKIYGSGRLQRKADYYKYITGLEADRITVGLKYNDERSKDINTQSTVNEYNAIIDDIAREERKFQQFYKTCLLYTSDAADE